MYRQFPFLQVFRTRDVPPRTEQAEPVSVRLYRAGDWSVVEIAGELDIVGVPLVRPLLEGEGPFFVFDLSRVTFMDCSGLGVLAASARTASQARGCVRVSGASSHVRKLVRLSRLDGPVTMFDSLEQALTAAAPSGHQADGRTSS